VDTRTDLGMRLKLTAKNAFVHCGGTIKPYEMPKKGEGGAKYVDFLQCRLEIGLKV